MTRDLAHIHLYQVRDKMPRSALGKCRKIGRAKSMKIKLSGRTKESVAAIQELVDFLEKFGEVAETRESILAVDGRETLLVAFSSQSYYERKGYYWFSLIPSNRRDSRWDLYIRFEGECAYFGVTEIKNHLDVTEQLHHFEQIWEKPAVEEIYVDEAIYIPDSLPEPDRKTGKVLRVVRDTAQSRYVKELYNYKCQICEWTIYSPRLKSLWYCEAHHVQPLGKKYRGPDHQSNIIALCPTHHCMMDLGVLAVEPSSLRVLSIDKREASKGQVLILRREHGLNQKYLKFHLESIYIGGYKVSEIPLSSANQAI
jgi:hypothetical protein